MHQASTWQYANQTPDLFFFDKRVKPGEQRKANTNRKQKNEKRTGKEAS